MSFLLKGLSAYRFQTVPYGKSLILPGMHDRRKATLASKYFMAPPVISGKNETVVLIHGLWMHGLVFLPHQRRLERHGFAVRRLSYPSWSGDLQQNVSLLAKLVSEIPASKIHLVGHSMGGLVALLMLGQHPDKRIQRVVLMGTPYAACYCGSYMAARPLLSLFLGKSMKDWLAQSRPAAPDSVDIGVIAGTHSWGLGRAVIPGLPQPNDGVVSLEETRLPGAKDSIALPVSHSGMLLSSACADQVASFITFGNFVHA